MRRELRVFLFRLEVVMSEPRIWICSWSKCRKISRVNSKNSYCQKCFEGTLIPFVQHAALEEALAQLTQARNERETVVNEVVRLEEKLKAIDIERAESVKTINREWKELWNDERKKVAELNEMISAIEKSLTEWNGYADPDEVSEKVLKIIREPRASLDKPKQEGE